MIIATNFLQFLFYAKLSSSAAKSYINFSHVILSKILKNRFQVFVLQPKRKSKLVAVILVICKALTHVLWHQGTRTFRCFGTQTNYFCVFSATPKLLNICGRCTFVRYSPAWKRSLRKSEEPNSSALSAQPAAVFVFRICLRSAPHNQPLTSHWG